MPSKVRYLVRIDPERKCVHVNLVNLVRNTNVAGEEEYLFAPCKQDHGKQRPSLFDLMSYLNLTVGLVCCCVLPHGHPGV